MKHYGRWIVAGVVLLVLLGMFLGSRRSTQLPVLMYHHFDAASKADTVVSEHMFREQMKALRDAGFTALTMEQVVDYVDNDEPLPKRPVLITMDDGYTSNLTIAAPILEEYGMRATVFVIGINEGETHYAHSGEPLYSARFAYEEAQPWVDKGVLDIQSHTFDMHQLASYGFSGRDGMRPMEGESHEAYLQALEEDFRKNAERREGRISTPLVALAYPFGYYTETADRFLEEHGIRLTFTVEEHTNVLRRGDPECTRMMGRFNVTDRLTGQELVQKLLHAL